MFTKLLVENFKAFGREQHIGLRPLTLLFGPNSAGKSSLYHALLLLAQNLRPEVTSSPDPALRFQFPGSLVDLGSYRGTIHGQQPRSPMSIGVSWVPWNSSPLDQHAERRYRLHLAPNAAQPVGRIRRVDLGVGRTLGLTFDLLQEPLSSQPGAHNHDPDEARRWVYRIARKTSDTAARSFFEACDATRRDTSSPPTERDVTAAPASSHRRRRPTATTHDDPAEYSARDLRFAPNNILPGWPDLTGPHYESVDRVGQALAHICNDLQQHLRGLRHQVSLPAVPSRDMPARALLPQNHSADAVEHAANHLEWVNEWLRRLELPYDLSFERWSGRQRLHLGTELWPRLTIRNSKVVLSLTDVGTGVFRLLRLLFSVMSTEHECLCIEQPELHVHPRLQAEMADLLIEAIHGNDGSAPSQIIVETHSEHLILRILRRMRETAAGDRPTTHANAVRKEDVAIIYVDNLSHGGSTLREILISESGEFLKPWPHGFFPERLAEI